MVVTRPNRSNVHSGLKADLRCNCELLIKKSHKGRVNSDDAPPYHLYEIKGWLPAMMARAQNQVGLNRGMGQADVDNARQAVAPSELGEATPEQIARRFVRGRAVTVEPLMESLAALGQAERAEDGQFAA